MSGADAAQPAKPALRAYPDLKSLCEAELGPFDRLYVTPHLDEAGSNPYLHRLYLPYAGSPSRPHPLHSRQFLRPFFRRLLFRERSAWHQHWLQFSSFPTFLRTNFRLLASALYVAAGGRILWTLHNERPHGDRWVGLNQWYCRRLAALCHRLHVHHAEAARTASALFKIPPDRLVLLPHPAYETSPIPRSEAREGLARRYGVDAGDGILFLMFGAIARYKGIDEVIRAFAALPRKGALLVVAGGVRSNEADYGRELRETARVPGVHLLDRHIPEEDVNLFLCAADFAVFNHRRSLTSGAMQLAADYGCRIIAPDLEAASALAGAKVRLFKGPGELAALLAEAVARDG